MRISDWSSDVCSSDLLDPPDLGTQGGHGSRWSGAESVRSRRLESPGKAALHTRLLIGSRRHPRPFTPRGSAIFVLCLRSEEHTSELQSLMRISYAVFCLKKKKKTTKKYKTVKY